jgi:glycyl-tRNA synthetase beta chain
VADRRDLLVEIGTEELPPKALPTLSSAFADRFAAQLDAASLDYGAVERYAAPRRLALIVRGLAEAQADRESVRRGPAVKAAFDADGQPTKAALGFARSCGVDIAELGHEETDKGSWLEYRSSIRGRATTELLPDMIGHALGELPIPKRMRWGDSDVSFVRPVHWACVLFGDEPVRGTVLDIAIGHETRGHRFHHPDKLAVNTPDDYLPALRAAYVEPDFQVRRQTILDQVDALASSIGGVASTPDALVDEVTALCEWPVALLGRFDEVFLEVPAEALIETMQQHQKYFAVLGDDGRLLPNFIAVTNIESRDPDVVRRGNERVIRPRFSDARFFWDQDLQTPLDARAAGLDRIVFQHKLGSVGDKVRRVARLSRLLAERLGYDAEQAERAALLGKCDLTTAMVSEFASLQGVMGRYYASHGGEAPAVSAAMEEQYLPRFAGDALPVSDCGRVLAIADRLDTLLGIFSIGERPTGVKDPYGLRRAAIGVLRILIEERLPLDLRWALETSAATFPDEQALEAVETTYAYMTERLRGYYAEQSVDPAAVDAVLSVDASEPADFDRRVRAVTAFMGLDSASALAAANKRIANILKKSGADAIGAQVQETQLVEPEEKALAQRVGSMAAAVAPLLERQDYETALTTLASLRPDVDLFFDKVMVMDEDLDRRRNRLALLDGLRALFSSIADISKLPSPERS